MDLTRRQVFVLLVILSIYILAWSLQTGLYLHSDNTWLMHETSLMLAGGSYYKDFFEINPPLILYIYIPPVILSHLSSINIIDSLRIYVLLLVSINLILCYSLTNKIFNSSDQDTRSIFLLTLAVILLIIPGSDYGQREHLMLIFTLPYLLLVSYRLQADAAFIKPAYGLMIGLFAALGFSLKPYFFITFALVELYYSFCKRDVFAWIRAETLAVIVFVSLYTLAIFIFHWDYIAIIVPKIANYYYDVYRLPWQNVLFYRLSCYCLLVLLFCAHYQNNPYKNLTTILMIAVFGFLTSFLIQRTLWVYHILPAYALAILLLMLVFSCVARQPTVRRSDKFFNLLMIGFLIGFQIFYFPAIETVLVLYPVWFFGLFCFVFALLLYYAQLEKNIIRLCGSLIAIITLGYIFSYMIIRSDWHSHIFVATFVILILSFGIFIPSQRKARLDYIILSLLGILIFSVPVNNFREYREMSTFISGVFQPLIVFLKEHARNKTATVFTMISVPYSSFEYANVIYKGRVPFFGWIPGVLKETKLHEHDTSFQKQLINDKNFYIDMISEDLEQHKPQFVLIDVIKSKSNLANIPFDYLDYFAQNKNFQHAWKPYHYYSYVDVPPWFQFQVYERTS